MSQNHLYSFRKTPLTKTKGQLQPWQDFSKSGRHGEISWSPLNPWETEERLLCGLTDKHPKQTYGVESKNSLTGGKKILAQSVIAAMPYYSMHTTLLPARVIKSIEQQIRNFLWGSSPEQKKCHLVKWDIVTMNTECGGLGLCKLDLMNKAFLAKIGCRIMQNKDNLLIRVLKVMYAVSSTDCSQWRLKQRMSNAWRVWSNHCLSFKMARGG